MLTFPAVWETEPQNSPDLNLYYEASDNIPTKINYDNVGLLIPIYSRVEVISTVDNVAPLQSVDIVENNRVTEVYDGTTLLLNNGLPKFDYKFILFYSENGKKFIEFILILLSLILIPFLFLIIEVTKFFL